MSLYEAGYVGIKLSVQDDCLFNNRTFVVGHVKPLLIHHEKYIRAGKVFDQVIQREFFRVPVFDGLQLDF